MHDQGDGCVFLTCCGEGKEEKREDIDGAWRGQIMKWMVNTLYKNDNPTSHYRSEIRACISQPLTSPSPHLLKPSLLMGQIV